MTTQKKLTLMIAEYANGNQSEFARMLGLSQPAIASWLKRDTMDVFLIARTFKDVSAEWLLRGEGEMLKSAHHTNTFNVNYGDHAMQAGRDIITPNTGDNYHIDNGTLHHSVGNTTNINSPVIVQRNRARNLHNGTGDIYDHSPSSSAPSSAPAPSSTDHDTIMALLQQNAELIQLLKDKK